jgi:putative transcriptional regulator
VTEHDAADQEHLRQVAQAEFVAQPPEYHERDDVRRVLRPVQQALTALVELLAAVAAAKSAVAARSARSVPKRLIHRQMIEDGEDPEAEPRFVPPVLAQDVRKKLGLTQAAFARLLGIPVATLRNWEQNRFVMEPAAKTLLTLIDREPEAALRALRGTQAA